MMRSSPTHLMTTSSASHSRLAGTARNLTAFEHAPIPIDNGGVPSALTTREADHLTLIGEDRPGFCTRGYQSIRLAHYCGLVGLGERVLEVLPKVDEARAPEECRGVLLRMLHEAEDFPAFRDLPVGHALRGMPLLEIFIAAFFDSVTMIAQQGMLRLYQEAEDDLSVVRGRIRSDRQFSTLFNRPDRLACRFDELTVDNRWNRLLKLGLRAVRPWIVADNLRRRWSDLISLFDEVTDVSMSPRALDGLVFDRHAARYRTAIQWVRWIATLRSPGVRAGESPAPGLLFDMNRLFESAVAGRVRSSDAFQGGVDVHAQRTEHYFARLGDTHRGAYRLRPDLVVRSGDSVVAIADTKWKRLEINRSGDLVPTEADLYQLYAYAAAYGCSRLALIYPWHSGLANSKNTRYQLPTVGQLSPIVHVVCIDVAVDGLPFVRGEDWACL